MRPRGAFTLVEVALVTLIGVMLFSVVWTLLGGGVRQSSFNLGRTEALMGAILALETVEEDLRHLCPTSHDDLSIFREPFPGSRITFRVARRAGSSPTGPLVGAHAVTYRYVPTRDEDGLLERGGETVRAVRVHRVRFVPRVVPSKGKGRMFFVQTLITTTDATGKHRLPLMGLIHLGILRGAALHPHWNPNPDPVPYREER